MLVVSNFGVRQKAGKILAHPRKWEIFSRDKKGGKNRRASTKIGDFGERLKGGKNICPPAKMGDFSETQKSGKNTRARHGGHTTQGERLLDHYQTKHIQTL